MFRSWNSFLSEAVEVIYPLNQELQDRLVPAQIKTCYSIFDDNNLLIFSNGHLFPVELIKSLCESVELEFVRVMSISVYNVHQTVSERTAGGPRPRRLNCVANPGHYQRRPPCISVTQFHNLIELFIPQSHQRTEIWFTHCRSSKVTHKGSKRLWLDV